MKAPVMQVLFLWLKKTANQYWVYSIVNYTKKKSKQIVK